MFFKLESAIKKWGRTVNILNSYMIKINFVNLIGEYT